MIFPVTSAATGEQAFVEVVEDAAAAALGRHALPAAEPPPRVFCTR